MNDKIIVLNGYEIQAILNTLKKIKVKGFNSMDRLVGLVSFFQNKLKENNLTTEEPEKTETEETE